MTKTGGFLTGLGAILILLLFWFIQLDGLAKKNRMEVIPIQVEKGWGYAITIDGKPFIRQDVIPSLPGRQAFASQKEALTVGHWVMDQIALGKSPSVSPEILTHLLQRP